MVVVGTEGWAGKTSVILSSALSHHRTNGLWEFCTAPKTRDGKRCQLACRLYCRSVHLVTSAEVEDNGQKTGSERANPNPTNPPPPQ